MGNGSLALVVALAFVGACAGAPKDLARAPEDDNAKQLYELRCSACHRLIEPEERTPSEWAEAVETFGPRARLRPEERTAVYRWLAARAKGAPAH